MPGVARRLLTFFVSPKKVSQESDRWVVAPFGVPGAGRLKSGRENNSLRSDMFPFLIRFDPAVTGYSQADFETGSLRIAWVLRWFYISLALFTLSFQRKLEPSVVKTDE